MYYDKEGNRITLENFLDLMSLENAKYRFVKQEIVGDFFISTVWLGFDHSFGVEASPKIFETMVFDRRPGKDHSCEEFCKRYPDKTSALEGHNRIVQAFRSRNAEEKI